MVRAYLLSSSATITLISYLGELLQSLSENYITTTINLGVTIAGPYSTTYDEQPPVRPPVGSDPQIWSRSLPPVLPREIGRHRFR